MTFVECTFALAYGLRRLWLKLSETQRTNTISLSRRVEGVIAFQLTVIE